MKLPFLPARAPYQLPRTHRRGCYPQYHGQVIEVIRNGMNHHDVGLYLWLYRCCDVAASLGMRHPTVRLPTPYYLM